MGSYENLSFFQLHDKITVEYRHIGKLRDAAAMWEEGAQWIGDTLTRFKGQVENLASHWPDKAGDAFAMQAQSDMNNMRSWIRAEGEQVALPPQQISTSPGEGWKYTEKGIVASNMAGQLRALADQLQFVFTAVDGFHRDYHASFDGVRAAEAGDDRKNAEEFYRKESVKLIAPLGAAYTQVADALPGASGRHWNGAQSAVVPELRSDREPGDGTPSEGGAPTTGGGAEAPNPGETRQPNPGDTPETPEEETPLTLAEQLDLASQGLEVAGKAVDLTGKVAEQLLGSGGTGSVDVPDPATVPNPLDGWKPADLPALSGIPGAADPLGLPGLAGLDSGGGGVGGGLGAGGIGTGGAGSPASGAVPPLAGTAGFATGTPTSGVGTGSAGMGGSPGMMPMYPQSGAGRAAGGGDIRPGAAEHVNAVRSRKPDGEPGVALRGRAGKPPRPPVARSRPVVENEVVHVLDEDLWQVNPATDQPKYRTGY
ncbi:WXG100 family type VII secretion target [Amycolatopsis keratiniphila]|uniref:PPE family domain-containing protein n=1 Tax=Amycolatopsis keratiniphila subsp. keratiniphila TaxID=227715 RepID=A0A1W2LZA5_9PSEU|nr:hypothetical protein [Amycolatopsis keratiniphila]ONF72563.1 hypothetical protein AVR91_0210245 [Amycolatopsis keratiniphila subsp. keratiniphila]